MSLPEALQASLPEETARTWLRICDVVPDSAYLGGGTAIAVRLRHRMSRDLDFFLQQPVDLEALADALGQRGALDVQDLELEPGKQTLNAYFDATKLQFMEASSLEVLEPFQTVAGIRVAALGDLLAMKLKVIRDRGELRDYYDVLVIEQWGHRRVEEGIALALRKYRPRGENAFIQSIVRGLGYLNDVEDDPSVPMPRGEIAAYWERRVPQIVSALSRSH